jgi:hypothetical protein
MNSSNKYGKDSNYGMVHLWVEKEYGKANKQQNLNPMHWGARAAVWRAVRSGKIERADCQVCSAIKTEAHHHKGYDKTNWLDVVWLCNKHHVAAHLEVIGNIYENKDLLE